MRSVTKLLIVCGVVGLSICSSWAEQIDISLKRSDWTGLMNPKEKNLPDGSLTWNLDGASYIFTKKRKQHKNDDKDLIPSLANAKFLVFTARVVTTGSPVFGYDYGANNPCVTAPTAHAILFSSRFDAHRDSTWYDEFGRWWGLVAYPLQSTPQGLTIRIPLTDDSWLSVYGKHPNDADPQARIRWNDVLANPGSVGLTFGGGCYLSHGITVTGGTAEFELVDYHFE